MILIWKERLMHELRSTAVKEENKEKKKKLIGDR